MGSRRLRLPVANTVGPDHQDPQEEGQEEGHRRKDDEEESEIRAVHRKQEHPGRDRVSLYSAGTSSTLLRGSRFRLGPADRFPKGAQVPFIVRIGLEAPRLGAYRLPEKLRCRTEIHDKYGAHRDFSSSTSVGSMKP